MRPSVTRTLMATLLLVASAGYAAEFAVLRGIVHDPQHRPMSHAAVVIRALHSDFELSTFTDQDGSFSVPDVPFGEYAVEVSAPDFASASQSLVVMSGSAPVLHFQLALESLQQKVEVSGAARDVDTESASRTSLVSRTDIAHFAGVDSSNSFRIVTDFMPGAYMVHDQLHVRGGHQVTWAMDGVPLPNTNIASNVGPQFSPKDVDYIEEQSGSYGADYGDRTYGVFNIATRTGFERDREGELVTSYGSYNTTDDQLSLGDHTERFAYYASLNGNRSDYGLEPPTAGNLHNQSAGASGFTSLIYNLNGQNQVRLNGGYRADYYQVPNDPAGQAAGVRDREREQDGFGTVTWTHAYSPSVLLAVSPFYHFNRAAFEGGLLDVPSATDNRASSYEGGQATLSAARGRSNLRGGVYAFAQQDNSLFSVLANDGSGAGFSQRVQPQGNLEAAFLEDQFKAFRWLTLSGGVRLTHFAGGVNENSPDPRAGVAVVVPRLKWTVRGAYSRFYQAPPLDTVSGPLLQYVAEQGAQFLPLRGERDEQHEFGVTIPFREWTADLAYFRTGARNFFDHDVIGNSNIFLPLTLQAARIRGYEATLRSPLISRRYRAHLAFSNQQAEGFGAVNGGLLNFAPPPDGGGFYLDHDQRNTLTTGTDASLPRHSFAAVNLSYGSGFLNGNGPQHLPGHATVDISVGTEIGESLTVRAEATNVANTRFLLDTSNTFGGSHFSDPRMIALQVRYRFHY